MRPWAGLTAHLYTSEKGTSSAFEQIVAKFENGMQSADAQLSPLSHFIQSLSASGVPVEHTRMMSHARVESASMLQSSSREEGIGDLFNRVKGVVSAGVDKVKGKEAKEDPWAAKMTAMPSIGKRVPNKVTLVDNIDLPLISDYGYNLVGTFTGLCYACHAIQYCALCCYILSLRTMA